MESVPSISQLTGVPVMSRELFAEHVGVSLDVVNGWVIRSVSGAIRFLCCQKFLMR